MEEMERLTLKHGLEIQLLKITLMLLRKALMHFPLSRRELFIPMSKDRFRDQESTLLVSLLLLQLHITIKKLQQEELVLQMKISLLKLLEKSSSLNMGDLKIQMESLFIQALCTHMDITQRINILCKLPGREKPHQNHR